SQGLTFEQNVGQVANLSQAQFIARGPDYNLFLGAQGATLDLRQPAPSPAGTTAGTVLRLDLEGADPAATLTGVGPLAATTSYFSGSDPAGWHASVPSFSQVHYANVYSSGIDLAFYGNNNNQLEYDFLLQPGSDPAQIRLKFEGASGLALDSQGNLLLHTPGGDILQQAPALYQLQDGVKQSVSGHFTLDAGLVGFQVGAYDHSRQLTIDPVLSYGSYLGGSGDEAALGVAV